jgi:N-acetylglutamate synthase-like GNAT family acetyltransferase
MSAHARLTIPSDGDRRGIVRAVVESFARGAGVPRAAVPPLLDAACGLIAFVAEAAYSDSPGELELTLELEKRAVRVQVHDWGRPVATAGGEFGAVPPALSDAVEGAVDVRIVNLGREGKVTSFSWPVELPAVKPNSAPALAAAGASESATTAEATSREREPIVVRDATPEDAEGISRLLYDHYALGYVHPDFYRPRWVAEQLRTGAVRSTIALGQDEVIGHHALLPAGGAAWAESGVAVVHPAYRGLGVFGRLMERTLAKASEMGLAAVCGEAVTTHPYSQRAEHAFGYRETALTLGSQAPLPSDGKRHAHLLSYRMIESPRRAVRLPRLYEAAVRDAYANAALETAETDRTAGADPSVTVSIDDERQTAQISIAGWDAEAEHRFGHEVREMLACHVDVLFVDVDLAVTQDIDAAIERLNVWGFFYAGLRPCALDGHDALRLQRLNSLNVELEQIVCDSEFARELRAYVLRDQERVEQIAD